MQIYYSLRSKPQKADMSQCYANHKLASESPCMKQGELELKSDSDWLNVGLRSSYGQLDVALTSSLLQIKRRFGFRMRGALAPERMG